MRSLRNLGILSVASRRSRLIILCTLVYNSVQRLSDWIRHDIAPIYEFTVYCIRNQDGTTEIIHAKQLYKKARLQAHGWKQFHWVYSLTKSEIRCDF